MIYLVLSKERWEIFTREFFTYYSYALNLSTQNGKLWRAQEKYKKNLTAEALNA
jgi:hypothetical protein